MIVGWRGIAVEVVGPDDLLEGLATQLPPFLDGDGEVLVRAVLSELEGVISLTLPDDLSVSGTGKDEVLRAASSRIELVLADRAPDRVTVHAGVVEYAGKALLLPGRSLAGKSTLVRALVEAGATYWSDDLAPLDASGRVHPYPRRMTVRGLDGCRRELPVGAVSVDAPPAEVGLIAVLRFESGAGWEVMPLTPGQAVLELVDNCVCIRRSPSRSLDALTALAGTATVLRGTRGDAEHAAGTLLELCQSS